MATFEEMHEDDMANRLRSHARDLRDARAREITGKDGRVGIALLKAQALLMKEAKKIDKGRGGENGH